MNVRARAATILSQVIHQQVSLANFFPYKHDDIDPQDTALLQALCFGVCRWYFPLNTVCAKLLNKPLKKKDGDVEALILIGLFQLIYQQTADHAVINETVGACEALRKPWANPLINALLRRFQREHETLLKKADANLGHPSWLTGMFKKAWPEHWQAICHSNNQQAPMTLRVNTQQAQRTDYLDLLQAADIAAEPTPYSIAGIQLTQPCPVQQLPHFADGWVSVQDEAAQLAAGLLQLEPGHRVLDACAAPGGKTCHILETEPNLAQVTALEINADRADRINDNLARLQLADTSKVKVAIADAVDTDSWWSGESYDRVLLDAPCSATGVIRRHPDIKLLRQYEDIAKLAAVQLELLRALWATLKPGGMLVYATCSVLPQENEQVIADFVAEQPDASADPITADWGTAQSYGRQLLPQVDGHDGFYYARLVKRQE